MPTYRLLSDRMELLVPAPRTPGIHLSDIIGDLATRMRMYEPWDEDAPGQEEAMELGLAVEWARVARLEADQPGVWKSLGTVSWDGIEITPDLFNPILSRPREFKGTWMSASREPGDPKLWRFEVQVGGYCWALGHIFQGRPYLVGELDVTYFRGSYRDEKLAARRLWEVEWTREEILHNWVMLTTHRERMLSEGWKPGAVLVEGDDGEWMYEYGEGE